MRTQISLTPEQHRSLQQLAEERGSSMSAVIREALDAVLLHGDRQQRVNRALAALGGFGSDDHDVGRRHDDYLDEAYGDR